MDGIDSRWTSTLAIIKPDAVRRHLTGEIISRIERKTLFIANMQKRFINDSEIRELYAEHAERDFFLDLFTFTGNGPSIIINLQGHEAVNTWRVMMGSTKANVASPGTIRGDFGRGWPIWENLVHGSDSDDNAKRELAIFFPK